MKYRKFQRILFNLSVLLSISLMTYAQTGDYLVSDSLIAGDTTIVRFHLGQYDPDKLTAGLNPTNVNCPEACPICNLDTIWSYKIELYKDTIFNFYFAVPLGTIPGIYQMFILDQGSFTGKGPYVNWIFTPPYIFENPRDTMICEGDTAIFKVRSLTNDYSPLWYQWYHNDVLFYSSINGYILGFSYTLPQDTGYYYCVISNDYGKDTSQTARLELYPMPANPGPPEGLEKFCPGTDTTWYSINSDPLAIEYTWHLFPAEAGKIEFQDTSSRVIWEPGYTGTAEVYVDLLGVMCGSISSDIREITVPGVSSAPVICIVGTDEETGKYRIVWEKSEIASEKLYKIYRESNQADVYLEIGSVNPEELGVFVDLSSAPDILSHRYKISYTDSCGNESELSDFHQTMHLSANMSINNDVNLIWSEYKGIAFPTYEIYRGNHPDSMQLLTQVPSTVTAYKDSDPPLGIIWYQIGMSNPAGCNPEKKAGMDFSSSRSNMEQVRNTSIPEVIFENKPFIMYPNPAEKELYFRFSKTYTDPFHYKIYNSTGIIVLEGLIHPEKNSIDISSLPSGIFIMELRNENNVFKTRFVCYH
jgi:hypothetical protein